MKNRAFCKARSPIDLCSPTWYPAAVILIRKVKLLWTTSLTYRELCRDVLVWLGQILDVALGL